MRAILVLQMMFCLTAFAGPPQPQVTSSTITKGSLVFDGDGLTFTTANQFQRIPFPKPQTSGSSFPSLPGLRFSHYEHRVVVSGTDRAPTDASKLTLMGDDGSSIDLIAGQAVEAYRVDITFSDQHHITLWKVASAALAPQPLQFVTIKGDGIRAPGRIPWTPDLTLMGSLNAAGGFIDTPNVWIIRGAQRTRVRIRPIITKKAPDPLLQPGDEIEVDQGSF